jgi:hypothetical protein
VQNSGLTGYAGLYFWNYGSPELMLFKRNSGTWTQLGSSYGVAALPAGDAVADHRGRVNRLAPA